MDALKHIQNKFTVKKGDFPWIELYGTNRTIMAETLAELQFTEGAEIGIAEGMHAELLLKTIPGLHLALIDAYKHYVGYEEYDDMEMMYHKMVVKMTPYNTSIYRDFSMEAVKKFEDESLDFVYIDAAHDFLNTAMDISEWSRKVRKGGVVFGHDFKFHSSYTDRGRKRHPVHVQPVVEAYMKCYGISPWFMLANDVKDPIFGWDNAAWLYVK